MQSICSRTAGWLRWGGDGIAPVKPPGQNGTGHDDIPMVHPSADFVSLSNCKSFAEYQKMYMESVNSPDLFWGRMAEAMHWEKKWDKVGPVWNFVKPADVAEGKAQAQEGPPVKVEWFTGALTNICYNCIDRHVEAGRGGKVAMIYEGNDPQTDPVIKVTYAEMRLHVGKWANVLKAVGVKKGDRVAIYMPMVLDLPLAMLACARIGAIHSVVFGGFAADALSSRIIDSETRVILTCDGVMRGNKLIELKKIADKACEQAYAQGVCVEHSVVIRRLGNETMEKATPGSSIKWRAPRDKWYHELAKTVTTDCPVEWMDAEAPLFMLYTSGSTGTPKGVVHSTAGYMMGAYATVKYVFDARDSDVFWCTADCGWITGHTYITYGPMLNGLTQVIFEGVPTYPDAGRLWSVVDRHKVSVFYTAPTAIRALMAKGDAFVTAHKRETLRLLGSVGEPINPEAWRWYYEVIGDKRCPIVDTWWQTETGSNLITSLPGAIPMKPGCATLPFFGCVPVVIDVKTGKEVNGPGSGYLCIKRPWPSMMRTVWNDHKRFEATYFSQQKGYYFTGDGCRRDQDGYIWITGRVDDVINVSGHRIGTAEIESVCVAHKACSEAAAVGYPHPVKGEGIHVYVVPMAGVTPSPELGKELVGEVRAKIGAFAAPDIIHWAPTGVPKTRSGKIMRRILRKIAHGEEDQLGDISTLADPSVVQTLLENRPKAKGK